MIMLLEGIHLYWFTFLIPDDIGPDCVDSQVWFMFISVYQYYMTVLSIVTSPFFQMTSVQPMYRVRCGLCLLSFIHLYCLSLHFLSLPGDIGPACVDSQVRFHTELTHYQLCSNGRWILMPCPPGTWFDGSACSPSKSTDIFSTVESAKGDHRYWRWN